MLRLTFTIAGNTFKEAIRQPIYFVLVLAGSLLQIPNIALAAYTFGFSSDDTEVDADDKLLLDMGLATVFVVSTLLAAFIATNVLSREIENKTALTVISKPVGRPAFVIGKYLGAAGAILMATFTMLCFFQLALRHEVMPPARHSIDLPVVTFAALAILISVGVGIWGNYFYNWVFSSVATALLAPTSFIAFLLTQVIGKEWQILDRTNEFKAWVDENASPVAALANIHAMPPPTEWWKPEVALACIAVMLALLVLTALAVAVSTRLGQVMTIVVCAGVFLLGLLSNYLLGQHAYQNTPISRVTEVSLDQSTDEDFDDPEDRLTITLQQSPDTELIPGTPIYFAPNPAGLNLINASQARTYQGDITNPTHLNTPELGRAVLIESVDREANTITLVNAGGAPLQRDPAQGDYVFLSTTTVDPAALAAWSVIPNLQAFWLIDAITQGHPIPWRYMALLIAYTAAQITGLIALAIMLFQSRDVG